MTEPATAVTERAATTTTTPMTPTTTTARRTALALAFLLFGVYALSAGGHTYSSDEEGMLLTTRRIFGAGTPSIVIDEGNAGLIPAVFGRNDELVGPSGLGQSLAMAPFLGIGKAVASTVSSAWGEYTVRVFVSLTNPLLTAAGVAVVFLIALELGVTRRRAVLIALVYGLGTFAWPHAKTLFSEPITTTMLLAAALHAVRLRTRGRTTSCLYVGLFLGLSLLGRPSAGVLVPIVCAYVAVVAYAAARLRGVVRAAIAVAIGAVPPVAVLLATNWWRFGSPTDLGYESVRLDYPIHEGLYGLFLSPGKGLFLYAPVVAVSIAAVVATRAARRLETAVFLGIALVNAVFFARYVHWHGDHAWGPRYLTMSLPFFVLPAALALHRLAWRRAVLVTGALGAVSALLGVAIYFNQYFLVAERELGVEILDDGPSYWRPMHFDPEWSPLVGHARLLDDAFTEGVDGFAGDLPPNPMPAATRPRYFWYFEPPSPDSWVYWTARQRGPRRLYALAVLEAACVAGGVVVLRRSLREP